MPSIVSCGRSHVRYLEKRIGCASGYFVLIYDRTHPDERLKRQAISVTLTSYFVDLTAGGVGHSVLFANWRTSSPIVDGARIGRAGDLEKGWFGVV